jgi:Fibronectin type III domain
MDPIKQYSISYTVLPMTTLRKAPFNLVQGNNILAKVSAINTRGWSIFSTLNTDETKIQTEPHDIAAPTRGILTNTNQIQVNWVALAAPLNGDSPVTSYVVFIDQANDTWIEVTIQNPYLQTSFIVTTGIQIGTRYGFKVQALNKYGLSLFS